VNTRGSLASWWFSRIGEENAFAVLARAGELAAQGQDIINLGIGQPDFPTPPNIVEAAIKALRDGAHGYTPAVGIPQLREAVAADLKTRHEPVAVPIRESNGFAFSAEETLSLITPKTRLLILNSPANPTGGVTPRAEFDRLAEGLAAHPHVAILSDEIYDHMTYDAEEHASLLNYPELRERLILLNGWSKTYAMTGWRLGYSVWPEQWYDAVRKLAVNCWSCVNAPAQFAALEALTGPQESVATMMTAFDERRRYVVDALNDIDGMSCVTPRGAFYAFPNITETGWKAKPLANALLEQSGIATIGGPDFGIHGEGYLRVSYANSLENIKRAIERMQAFLATQAAPE